MYNMSAVNYSTDVDYDLLMKELPDEEIIKYISDNFIVKDGRLSKPFKNVFKFLKLVCKLSKIQPSNEQLVYILANNKRMLCEACAGAGKTTMSYFRLILFNAFYGIDSNKMLGLCYNRHSADAFGTGYTKIARSINLAIGSSGRIGTKLHAYTIHSWCKIWVEEYKSNWGITKGLNIIEENDVFKIINQQLATFIKKNEINVNLTDSITTTFVQLYSYVRETLSIDDPTKWYNRYPTLHFLTSEQIQFLIKRVSQFKTLMKYIDFGDLLEMMYELLQKPEVLARIRANYDMIVVDEWQDITPAMSRIIELLMQGDEEKGIPPHTGYLTVIGDGDQSIYDFRGTDSDNCIKFRYLYGTNGMQDEVKITSMSINRRCKSEILSYAKDIITSLSRRIQKPVNYLTVGGNVKVHTYTTEQNQSSEIINILNNYRDELYDTCICYRSLKSSSYISMELLKNNIPFNVARGVQPFQDIYSSTLDGILKMLNNPEMVDYIDRSLYKLVPRGKFFKKSDISAELKAYEEKRKTSNRNNVIPVKKFWEYDFTAGRQQARFNECIDLLRQASTALMNGKPMLTFMPAIIELLKTYYLDGLTSGVMKDKISDEYMAYIERYYCSTKSYNEFCTEIKKYRQFMDDNKNSGVYLTTFHGLKGLEFKNTILIELNDDIFPGVDLKDEYMTPEQLEFAESEARRLFYVAVTRAKDNMHLLFHRTKPTRYIRYFTENKTLSELYTTSSNTTKDINPVGLNTSVKTVDNFILNKETNLFSNDASSDFVFTEDLSSSVSLKVEAQEYDADAPIEAFDILTNTAVKGEEATDITPIEDSNTFDELPDIEELDELDSIELDDITDESLEIDSELDDLNGLDELDPSEFENLEDNPTNNLAAKNVVIEEKTPYDELRATKPRLTNILDILRDKTIN